MNRTFYGAASITASKRVEIINIENSQGPGSYDVNKQKATSSSPKWTLKPRLDHGSCFKQLKQNRPPPGLYQIAGNLKQKVTLPNPNYRSDKHKPSNQKVNHMSDLNLPSSINTKSCVSFGFRDQLVVFKNQTCSPGPVYNTAAMFESQRGRKIKNNCRGFGYGERNAIYKLDDAVPGPGAYCENKPESSRLSPTSSTFGKSPRQVHHATSPLGPGEYYPQTTMNGNPLLNLSKGFKLKGKLPQTSKYTNPTGPGTYDLPQTKSSIGPRFNHCKNKSMVEETNEMPCPFTYECLRYPEMISESKGFSLGKRLNGGRSTGELPGPGAYEVAESVAGGKVGGYMGRKLMRKRKVAQEDCFGKYEPNYSASARYGPKFSFANDQKPWNKPIKDQTLGPAHYVPKQNSTIQTYSMGTSQRFKQMKKQRNYVNTQTSAVYSTIGYLPSYLKKSPQNKHTLTTHLNNSSVTNNNNKKTQEI